MSLKLAIIRQRQSREIAEATPKRSGEIKTGYRSFPMEEPKVEYQKIPEKPRGWPRSKPLTPKEERTAIKAIRKIRLPGNVSSR